MRILVVHNSYQIPGGEDKVFSNEVTLLREKGHHVKTWLINNQGIVGIVPKILAAINSVFSVSSYIRMRCQLRRMRPDIVHVHNFFPQLSPSIFIACQHEGVPVVLTLHNYRLLCPTATLMHGGLITERSLDLGPWWAVRKKVYKNSMLGTFFIALMIDVHRRIGTWRTQVHQFITLTQFAATIFTKAGLPQRRLFVKPNFVKSTVDFPNVACRSGFLFVGRLSPEKGVSTLLAAMTKLPRNAALRIAGDGKETEDGDANDRVVFLGQLNSTAITSEMFHAEALILPSLWYEGFPMVLVEAYACGLPVIASRIGALAELVEDGVTGLHFEAGNVDDLAKKMHWALEHPAEMKKMGDRARAIFEARYSADRNYELLMNAYARAKEQANLSRCV